MRDPLMSRHVPADPGTSKRMMVKANTSLVGPAEGVALRFLDQRTDPELEFAIVSGRTGTNVPKERAFEMVAGYAIGFDMSLRGPMPPSSRKSIDTYSVLGPWMATRDEIPDPDDVMEAEMAGIGAMTVKIRAHVV